MLLPGQDLQLQIGDRRRGSYGMAPETAQEFHMGLQIWIAGEFFEGIENVDAAHLLKTPEQIAGIIQHDPRVAALCNQLGMISARRL